MTTIAIACHKGGVGKTTTAVTLGYALAARGKCTLIVDLDSQGSASWYLGYKPEPGLHRLIQSRLLDEEDKQLSVNDVIFQARKGLPLWLLPSDDKTASAKIMVGGMPFGRDTFLADLLRGVRFDVILLDCGPSQDILQILAFAAADWLLAPVKPDSSALLGLGDLFNRLSAMRGRNLSHCEVLGVLPTFVDRVTGHSIRQLTVLAEHFPQWILDPIPVDTKLRDADEEGLSIWEYAPNSRAVVGVELSGQKVGGYLALVERTMEALDG